ncbi:MAG: hypothetical protein A2087_04255 [Spirochaetes bacterium GWD1_61_31]|nr:MAG: hypothetical protein A2Y37_10820 [Spirochaetes bacterium GWB1_60_80]OHD29415.1 MAG: hypothetical protein A2004_03815 [Spirochaetes bacterium GWC1_61_12]OHD35422.1 MAG: hypothetical protein A2087_04255 [Spirochaetes bacterium GWD1_61_31]OHD44931.1 MAG: hypothetical protein A2Y35_12860 [Spirochaetes bacterium GWE1_60_18]OHD60041.1 MAG: hypothetical protein A2Y32_10975 [Spirochaetes bacterium GWF1_60_12]
MKISTRSRYGLRLLMDLASRPGDKPVFLGDIAARLAVSEKYLSKLVIPMRRAGLIRSVRGAYGGYALAIQPASLSLCQIIECLEGSLSLVDCVEQPDCCERAEDCTARRIWGGLEKVMHDYCMAVSLADLVGQETAIRA